MLPSRLPLPKLSPPRNKSKRVWYMIVLELKYTRNICHERQKRGLAHISFCCFTHNYLLSQLVAKFFDTLSSHSSIHSFTDFWLRLSWHLPHTHNSASVYKYMLLLLLLSPSIRTSPSMKFLTNDFHMNYELWDHFFRGGGDGGWGWNGKKYIHETF